MLEMTFLLNSCLDIFDIRQNNKTSEQDLGLLQAVDERLATYGWLTNTGIKFIIVVDMAGRPTSPDEHDKGTVSTILGLRGSDLRPVRSGSMPKCVVFLIADGSTGIPSLADCLHSASSKSILLA